MELVSQASLLAAQTERSNAPADRARLRDPTPPEARSQSVDRRADPAAQRSFPVDQLDIRPRVHNRREPDPAARKSASLSARIEASISEERVREEQASRRRDASQKSGVGRRESPLSKPTERPAPPGSYLNITA